MMQAAERDAASGANCPPVNGYRGLTVIDVDPSQTAVPEDNAGDQLFGEARVVEIIE